MIDLNRYGYTEFYKTKDEDFNDYIPARVIEVHRELFKVVCQYGECNAKLKGSYYNTVKSAEDFPVVGDFVYMKYNNQGDSIIVKVSNRKSKFSRTDYSGHGASYVKTILEQVVASNFDYVFIIASLNYDFNIKRIQRYLTVAWQSGGTPVIVLTKADLVEDFSQQLQLVQQHAIGVEVVVVSSITSFGLKELSKYMVPTKTLVFLGSSGVGKSTLVNALAGEEIMKVKEIREEDSKGRHTTTHRQLIMLNSGAMIIDTPGMRELGMWDIDEGLGETFADIEEIIMDCKYSDCTHKNEPGCAIKQALEEGTLDTTRWNNYMNLKSEIKFTEDKTAYLRSKNAFFKKMDINNKNRKKMERAKHAKF